jgi:hypothetical protein
LQAAVDSVTDQQEKHALSDAMEAQWEAQALRELQGMAPDERDTVLTALTAPENDPQYWEDTLMEPLMQDMLREVCVACLGGGLCWEAGLGAPDPVN